MGTNAVPGDNHIQHPTPAYPETPRDTLAQALSALHGTPWEEVESHPTYMHSKHRLEIQDPAGLEERFTEFY